MSGESGTSRNGTTHYYYNCISKKKRHRKCGMTPVKKHDLEDLVLDLTMSMLSKSSTIHKIAKNIVEQHEQMIKEESPLMILQKKRKTATRAVENIIKAIEQGIINEFTKDRLSKLQDEINQLDIEINREKQRTYDYLTVEDVERYLTSKVLSNTDDIKIRKMIINTFIHSIIWYGDSITIIYNFQENGVSIKTAKDKIEDMEKQIEEGTQSVFSFSLCSSIVRQSAP